MSLADVTRAFLDLRENLPALLAADWPRVQGSITAQLDRLEAATGAEERQAAIDVLITLLIPFEAVQPHLRRALAAGRATRGGRRSGDVGEEDAPGRLKPRSSRDGEGATELPRLERWPHVDVDGPEPKSAGVAFTARVYVDARGPEDVETSAPLDLPDLPEVPLRVVLVTSHHFAVEGEDGATIVVKRGEERSTSAEFRVRTVAGASGQGVITAFFAHDGRPAGSVHRQVAVEEAVVASAANSLPEPALSADLTARRPDLTVEIAPNREGGGQRFACIVSSPHLPEYTDGTTADWDLPATTDAIVASFMAGFTQPLTSNAARRAGLVGAGLRLFRAAPENFRAAYWALRDGGHPLDTVFVVSSEPYVPWELMIPNRDGEEDAHPIGASSAVGRWVHPQHVSPPEQRIALEDSYVIAPTYLGTKRLGFSADEARFVCDAFAGQQISPAVFETIEAVLGARGATLLHLICHGADGAPGSQTIDLDPDETLTDVMLEGMTGLKHAVASKHPMVFINACEVGRQTPALVGTGGFATAFIALGARCVVAPIWKVKDAVAAEVARAFYIEVKAHPGRPFAEILGDIRRKAYDGPEPEDSWAAYCFYGDPLAAEAPA